MAEDKNRERLEPPKRAGEEMQARGARPLQLAGEGLPEPLGLPARPGQFRPRHQHDEELPSNRDNGSVSAERVTGTVITE